MLFDKFGKNNNLTINDPLSTSEGQLLKMIEVARHIQVDSSNISNHTATHESPVDQKYINGQEKL